MVPGMTWFLIFISLGRPDVNILLIGYLHNRTAKPTYQYTYSSLNGTSMVQNNNRNSTNSQSSGIGSLVRENIYFEDVQPLEH